MKVVVLGAGLMGKETARDLVKSDDVQKVYLADLDVGQAEAFAKELASDKLEVVSLDATDDTQLGDVMALGDVVVNALFYIFNEKVAKTAIERGVHSIDLGGHIGGATDAVLKMTEEAKAKGVTIIPDLGVAPGMINVLAGYGAGKLDTVETMKIFVGGIPVKPELPLNYNVVFSLEGVFDHYTDPSHVIRNGELKEVASLSEIEEIEFEGFGKLEAFHTSGGTSTLTESFSDVETLEYKTIRYKGHAEKFQLLVDLGLLSRENEVTVDGKTVKVRDVMREHLSPQLRLGKKADAVLLRVLVSGKKDGNSMTYEYDLLTQKAESNNITAMARATANTMSIVAQMIGTGKISKRGVYPPEKIVPGEDYIAALKDRGVVIHEKNKIANGLS